MMITVDDFENDEVMTNLIGDHVMVVTVTPNLMTHKPETRKNFGLVESIGIKDGHLENIVLMGGMSIENPTNGTITVKYVA